MDPISDSELVLKPHFLIRWGGLIVVAVSYKLLIDALSFFIYHLVVEHGKEERIDNIRFKFREAHT
jgi:hypothetical protein